MGPIPTLRGYPGVGRPSSLLRTDALADSLAPLW